MQNYPNPFNNQTHIAFDITESGKDLVQVSLQVFDVSGKLIKTLLNDRFTTGSYQIFWDGTNTENRAVSSGIYFCRMKIDQTEKISKMMLVR